MAEKQSETTESPDPLAEMVQETFRAQLEYRKEWQTLWELACEAANVVGATIDGPYMCHTGTLEYRKAIVTVADAVAFECVGADAFDLCQRLLLCMHCVLAGALVASPLLGPTIRPVCARIASEIPHVLWADTIPRKPVTEHDVRAQKDPSK